MTNSFLEDVIRQETILTIESIFNLDTENFAEQVRIANLDVRRELRHADLSGVCFDNSDLRGFDFTGADLRDATGRNVQWDESTILNGANVSGSVFAYILGRQTFFAREPTWHKLYMRKQKEHWASNANWFSERLAAKGPDRPYLIEVAKAICDSTSDGVLRSQLLLELASTFDSASQHRDFLIHNLAKHADNNLFVRASMQAMVALYRDDATIQYILKREISNPDYTVREAAVRGLMESKSFRENIGVVAAEVRKCSTMVRRLFVYHAARSVQHRMVGAVMEPSGQFAIDFEDIITVEKIERIAFARLLAEEQKKLAGERMKGGVPRQPHITSKMKTKRSQEYRYFMEVLRDRGVPFRFEDRRGKGT